MLIALVAALAIGGSIGYALKQPGVVTHTITKTVGLPASDTSRSSSGQIWIGNTLYTQDGPGEPWHKQP